MSHFFFFVLGFGCCAVGCWLHSRLREIGTILVEPDEHEGLTK